MELKVINKSPDKATMEEQQNSAIFTYLKDMSYNEDSTLLIELVDEDNIMSNIIVTPTCGCTVSKTTKNGNIYSTEIVYDTTRRGSFTKQIQVSGKEINGKTKKSFITIKGRVL